MNPLLKPSNKINGKKFKYLDIDDFTYNDDTNIFHANKYDVGVTDEEIIVISNSETLNSVKFNYLDSNEIGNMVYTSEWQLAALGDQELVDIKHKYSIILSTI